MTPISIKQQAVQLVERPGYLGRHRDAKIAELNQNFGVDGWQFVWKWGVHRLNFVEACGIYEDAYHSYLMANPAILALLITEASEVYDDEVTNIDSGFDYTAQETKRTHVQDIAIRRSLRRLGTWFAGPEPIRIRDSLGSHRLSMVLSPGQVPFHMSEMIDQPSVERQLGNDKSWWQPNSVEAFYQSNRWIALQ